jgi:hypothetical protein
MSGKVVQLEFLPREKEEFEEIALKSFRGLFARDAKREKQIEALLKRFLDLEEIVYHMNNRVINLSEKGSS